MKNQLFLSTIFFFVLVTNTKAQTFHSVEIDTVLKDKISIRAISIVADKIYFAGDKSKVGFIRLSKQNNNINQAIVTDTIPYEYRSLANNGKNFFALSIGNPARLYKFSNDLADKTLVYQENHEKVFYDSMQFWNEKEGIAIGDPTADCLSVIITRDGGNHWAKISCDNLPKVVDGEAAFAASNTNIVIK
ncbi:MAG: oxidoreductase, partial [Bacteroidia bacterium]